MSDQATTLPAERAIYRDYERKRRLRLATTLLPIFAVIQFGVFLVSALLLLRVDYPSPYEQLFIANTVLVGIDSALHVLGIRFARREQVGPATLFVVIPTGLTILVPALSYSIVNQFAPVSNSPLVPISLSVVTASTILVVLAGLLFNARASLLWTTLVLNGFTIYIMANVLRVPGIGIAMTSGALLLMIFPVFVQWATAGILYATSETYVKTLQELGDVRIAYERAQQLDQLKDQFIAHINHELRNPVMALLGYVELLLLTDESLTPAERHSYLERAKRTGDQLAALVTSILAARGLEQDGNRMPPEVVGLREVLDSALDLIDPRDGQNAERKLEVNIPDGLAVWGAPVRVRQIMTNLLSNAIKYSAPGTPIEVTARVQGDRATPNENGNGSGSLARLATRRRPRGKPSPPMVEVSVRDHGLGIPPEQIPLLFNRFVRLPRDLASSVAGNGLGLYLCQAYAEAMGGAISVESSGIEGEGSTFHLHLPQPPGVPAPAAVVASTTTDPEQQVTAASPA
ncbi:MAG: sensor histidine kinase [Ktedonobacterales bacterium]